MMNFHDFLETYKNEKKSIKKVVLDLDRKKVYREHQKAVMDSLVKSLKKCNIDYKDNHMIELLITKANEEIAFKQLGKKTDTSTGLIMGMFLTPTISNIINAVFKYNNDIKIDIVIGIVQIAVISVLFCRFIKIFSEDRIPQDIKIYVECVNDLRNYQLFYMTDYIKSEAKKDGENEKEREKVIS